MITFVEVERVTLLRFFGASDGLPSKPFACVVFGKLRLLAQELGAGNGDRTRILSLEG